MKVIEEKYLKKEIEKLNKYTKENPFLKDFYSNIDFAKIDTLQNLSFKSDLQFFDEISFILSVITSIIAHPHMLNKKEEIIVRSELANAVTPEMFQKTLRDSLLWKEDESLNMIPQYVYYHQHIDELRIYENIFIVALIKLIEQEINKYNDFYVSNLITYVDQEKLSEKDDMAVLALSRIKKLTNRIKHIKNTYFFKEINKGGTRLGIIHPTNILLKDRLYNYCFKFYKKMITYEDPYELLDDMRSYYYLLITKALKEKGFEVKDLNKAIIYKINRFVISKTTFTSEVFDVTISKNDKFNGLEILITNKKINENNSSKHLLLFTSEPLFKDVEISKVEGFDTTEILSLWNLALVDETITTMFKNPISEENMAKKYLYDKLTMLAVSIDLYSEYCPICKSNELKLINDTFFKCVNCNSKFSFFKHNKKDYVWFNRIRRV